MDHFDNGVGGRGGGLVSERIDEFQCRKKTLFQGTQKAYKTTLFQN